VRVDAETTKMLQALGYFAGDPGRPDGEGRGNPVELMPVHDELQRVGELLASGQPREAVTRAQGALAMDPENLAALRNLSRGLAMLGRLDEAADAAAKASAVAPWSAQAAMVEADVEFQRGRHRRALELIDHALELDERFVEARLDRARYLAALGRTEEASATLQRLLAENPDNSWVELRYAEIVEIGAGNLDAARRRLREVLTRNPQFAEAWLLLGTVATRSGSAPPVRKSALASLYSLQKPPIQLPRPRSARRFARARWREPISTSRSVSCWRPRAAGKRHSNSSCSQRTNRPFPLVTGTRRQRPCCGLDDRTRRSLSGAS
jgi:tetratricopeptide (TPR) repeat protein